jgi:hypothetical protein
MDDLTMRDGITAALGCTDADITTFCHEIVREDASWRRDHGQAVDAAGAPELAAVDGTRAAGDKLRPPGGALGGWPRQLIADSPVEGKRILPEAMRADVASQFEKLTDVKVSARTDHDDALGLLANLVVRRLMQTDSTRAKRQRRSAATAAKAAAVDTPGVRVKPAESAAKAAEPAASSRSGRVSTACCHFGACIRTWHAPVVPASLVDRMCMRALDGGNLLNGHALGVTDPLRAALEFYNGPGPNNRPPFAIAFLTGKSKDQHSRCVGPLMDWGWAVEVGYADGADDDACIEICRRYAVKPVTNDKLVDRIVLSAQAGDNDEYATDVQLVSASRIGYTFEGGKFMPNDPGFGSGVAEAFRREYSDGGDGAFSRWQALRVDAARQRRQADGGQALARWRSLNPGGTPNLTMQRRVMKDLGCTERDLAEWVDSFARKPAVTQRPASTLDPATGKAIRPRSLLMRFITPGTHGCTPQELAAIGDDFAAWGWPRSLQAGAVTPDAIAQGVLSPMLRARARDYAAAKKAAARQQPAARHHRTSK